MEEVERKENEHPVLDDARDVHRQRARLADEQEHGLSARAVGGGAGMTCLVSSIVDAARLWGTQRLPLVRASGVYDTHTHTHTRTHAHQVEREHREREAPHATHTHTHTHTRLSANAASALASSTGGLNTSVVSRSSSMRATEPSVSPAEAVKVSEPVEAITVSETRSWAQGRLLAAAVKARAFVVEAAPRLSVARAVKA